jgi:hypothetical protein
MRQSQRVRLRRWPSARAYIPREDATSPTVSTQAAFLSCLIHEGRDVAAVDIPGALMQADMDDLVHLRLTEKWMTCFWT